MNDAAQGMWLVADTDALAEPELDPVALGCGCVPRGEDVPQSAACVVLCSGDVDGQAEALRARLPGIPVAALIRPGAAAWPEAVDQLFAAGPGLGERLHRWAALCQRPTSAGIWSDGSLTALIGEMSARPDLQDVLRAATIKLSALFAVEQVSVVLFRPGEEHAFVVAERDRELDNIVLRLADYPELQEVIRTREPLVIGDVFGDALLDGVRQKLQDAGVQHRSAVLFPLVRRGAVVGALFLRATRQVGPIAAGLLQSGRVIATVTALAIGNALEQDALIRAREDAHQEVRDLRSFAEFFEQAQDGIVVTDGEGMVRYANPAAAQILRRPQEALVDSELMKTLQPRYHRLATRALAEGTGSGHEGYVDLVIAPVDGEEVVISAAIRPLARQAGALISFRDVTELREIESELRQTKEFLENLIHSSVDAIIAADMEGIIILFNRAAEEVLGYSARDVVGKLNVADLYPPGEAADVMRRLRSDAHGGRGRLEILRKELIAKGGEQVPVNLTAAIIFEDDTEIASVGIFADLRERLRMEEKLNHVQRQLQLSERQAIAVELAGAAAHELNQPLTSIMGYAELLRRRMGDDLTHRKPIDIICRETERMAGIVRQIGQITDYKSKTYVRGSKILDLEEPAGENPTGAPVQPGADEGSDDNP